MTSVQLPDDPLSIFRNALPRVKSQEESLLESAQKSSGGKRKRRRGRRSKKQRLSRHGRHKTETVLFQMWLPVRSMAKLRRFAANAEKTVTRVVLDAIGPMDTIALTKEDEAWISERLAKNSGRGY